MNFVYFLQTANWLFFFLHPPCPNATIELKLLNNVHEVVYSAALSKVPSFLAVSLESGKYLLLCWIDCGEHTYVEESKIEVRAVKGKALPLLLPKQWYPETLWRFYCEKNCNQKGILYFYLLYKNEILSFREINVYESLVRRSWVLPQDKVFSLSFEDLPSGVYQLLVRYLTPWQEYLLIQLPFVLTKDRKTYPTGF